MRLLCFLLVFISSIQKVNAQSVFRGRVYELRTREAIGGAIVENSRTKFKVATDSSGRFQIPARKNDLLVFSSLGFRTDTLLLTRLSEHEVYLSPIATQLKEVTVVSGGGGNWNPYTPDFRWRRLKYQRDEKGDKKGGLLIALYHKNSRKKRKAKQFLQEAEVLESIDLAFTAEKVSKYIPLKGEDLRHFIALFRPSTKVFQSPGFDFLLYLNESYKKFLALPPDQRRLPPLSPP